MKNAAKIFLLFCMFFAKISVAQTSMDSLILKSKKIDFENLKQLTDRFSHHRINCDSTQGTTLELRYCLNMQLQQEDSLLKKALNDKIKDVKDILFIKEVELIQEIWERYRYAYCSRCVSDEQSKVDMFFFMRCAIELTIKRREDIEKMCVY